LGAEGLAFFAADLDIDCGERTTDAFAIVLPLLGGVQRAEGRALGEAVADAEGLAEVREELTDARLELGRDGRSAAPDHAERGEVRAHRLFGLDEALEERGRITPRGDFLSRDEGGDRRGV